jgi:hypothetical protein
VRIDAQRSHLDIGTIVTTGGVKECVPISSGGVSIGTKAPGHAIQYAITDPTCDVWWREVSPDVVPPIPELALSFGTDSHGHKLGLCRTFGEDVSVDGGHKIVGTFFEEGPDFGRCFFVRPDGSTGFLDGGLFHVMQARAAEESCIDDPGRQAELSVALRERLDKFITLEDKKLLEKVVGAPLTSYAELYSDVISLGSCDLQMVLSSARFVPHQLNIKGMQVLRAQLAERMADARAEARGYSNNSDYLEWKHKGIIFKDFKAIGDEGLHRLMKIALGEETLAIPSPPYDWVMRNVSCQSAWDPQNDVHIDTFYSIVKIWIFGQNVTLNEGPFAFAPGSHRNSEGRLRWMHAYSLPPATEASAEPSFRILGSMSAIAAAPDFVTSVLKSTSAVVPLPGVRYTLVIADTSALHGRARGLPGYTRNSWRLRGDTDGGLKRVDPYRLPFQYD